MSLAVRCADRATYYGRTIDTFRDPLCLKLLMLIRLCTFNSPIRRGRLRLSRLGMKLSERFHGEMIVPTVDGRSLYADLSTGMCETLFFLGEYERAVTRMISSVVEVGDLCMDIGANFGWYATRLRQLCGRHGAVHAFEPVPAMFSTLRKNVGLLPDSTNVYINNVAIGDAPGTVRMHIFKGVPNGHTSISAMGRTDYSIVESRMITLDSYIESHDIPQVDFIKVDVEGAELMLLKGGEKLFQQDRPPIWMIEMALGTTKGFGYIPNDLITFMRNRVDYEFYAVDEPRLTLKPISGFSRDHIGANVLCIPSSKYGEKCDRAKQSVSEAIAA